MDLSWQNQLHHFASSSMYPSNSSELISYDKQPYQASLNVSTNQNESAPRSFANNSFLELLNSPLDTSQRTQMGFERFTSPNLFGSSNSSSFLGKATKNSSNKENVMMVNDDQLVHEYQYLYPSAGLQDFEMIVPFLSPESDVNRFLTSGYFVPEIASNNNSDGLNVCNNRNDFGHVMVTNANNRNTSKKKKKKKIIGNAKGKSKIARESSPDIIKGHWSPDEDRLLLQQVERFGVGRWTKVAKYVKGREGKQCRERWFNYLRPDIKTESWTEEEDQVIIEAYDKMGSKWSVIQNLLPGRTENSIKNHWNTVKRRVENRLASTGRQSSTTRKNTRLEKFILSLISTHPTRMPKYSRRNSKASHDDSSNEDEEFEGQQAEDVPSYVVREESYKYPKLEVKEDITANDTFNADYYKVGLPVVPAVQHLAAASGSSSQFGNFDPVSMQQLMNDFDTSKLINNQEDSWKAEMEAVKMFLAKDL